MGSAPNNVSVDIGLAGMNGLEIARTMRRKDMLRSAKLVALTGWGLLNDPSAPKEAGFNPHFTRPINIDALRLGLSELELPLAH